MSTTTEIDAARARWEAWRAGRSAELSRPHGWLSLTGLHWLEEEPATVADLPGTWSSVDGGVELRAAAADSLVLDGRVVDGVARIETPDGAPGVLVEAGERRVEVMQRSGMHALRVRDPQAPTLAAFRGVPVFDYDERFAVEAVFSPFEAPRDVVVGAVVEGLRHHQNAVGTVRFDLDGPRELVVFSGGSALSAQFTDGTSGVTTTGTTRSVSVPEPGADGRLVLDLNLAQNLPCAFTDHATCPLPPAENRLAVAVEAGEKDPR